MSRAFVCSLLIALFTVQSLAAQHRPRRPPPPPPTPAPSVEFGVRGGYDFDARVGSGGTQFRIPLARAILLAPSGDVFFDDAPTQWQLNLDLLVRPVQLGGLYAAAGVAFVSRDFDEDDARDTRAGFNLAAGLRGARITGTNVRSFVEARWTEVDDYSPFRLVAGIDVPISGAVRR